MQKCTILVCNACQFEISTVEMRTKHYRSDWHRYNVKRRCAGLAEPVEEKVFLANLADLRSNQNKSNETKCQTCKKTFHSSGSYQQHLLSKTHKKRSARASLFRTTAATSTSTTEISITIASTKTMTTTQAIAATTPNISSNDMITHLENSDQVMTVKKQYEHKAIPLGTCLFCPLKFSEIDENMTHMYKRHGFWIPKIKDIVSLEDFLLYLGEKIGLGRICLNCNGRKKAVYRNLHAVQQHMDAKSHCRLRWDEEDMDEYDIFFRFPNQGGIQNEGDEGDEGDEGEEDNYKKGKKIVEINAGGEIFLQDGTIIGHRTLRRAYKQNLHIDDTREEVVIARLEAECRKLMLRKERYQNKHGFSERTRPIWKMQNKRRMQIGIKANKLQHYFRAQNPI